MGSAGDGSVVRGSEWRLQWGCAVPCCVVKATLSWCRVCVCRVQSLESELSRRGHLNWNTNETERAQVWNPLAPLLPGLRRSPLWSAQSGSSDEIALSSY